MYKYLIYQYYYNVQLIYYITKVKFSIFMTFITKIQLITTTLLYILIIILKKIENCIGILYWMSFFLKLILI